MSENTSVSIFIFAHQDDEFGVYQQILLEKAKGNRVVCCYITTGVGKDEDCGRRERESIRVLLRLGVTPRDVIFAGSLLEISDQALLSKLNIAGDWMYSWLESFPCIEKVFLPAWEGGHPDHDCLHAVGLQICHELEIKGCVRQFPLYNAYRCAWKFFRVLYPLRENGYIYQSRIPLRTRFRLLRYMLCYPSQWTSWVGIFPFVLFRYLLNGRQETQAARLSRIRERPHGGGLYYERRGFVLWSELSDELFAWLDFRQKSL